MPNIDSEDFLAHYGVKGMRWGQTRGGKEVSAGYQKLANKGADKGDKLRAKAGGTGKAYGRIAARRVAVAAVTLYGPKVVSSIAKNNPSVRVGARVAAQIVNNGMFIKDAVDANNVRLSRKREKTS